MIAIRDGRYTVVVIDGVARSGPVALETVLGAFAVRELERLAKELRRQSRQQHAAEERFKADGNKRLAEHNYWLAKVYDGLLAQVERRMVRLRNGTARNRRRMRP